MNLRTLRAQVETTFMDNIVALIDKVSLLPALQLFVTQLPCSSDRPERPCKVLKVLEGSEGKVSSVVLGVTWTSKVPQIMAQYPKTESIGSIFGTCCRSRQLNRYMPA